MNYLNGKKNKKNPSGFLLGALVLLTVIFSACTNPLSQALPDGSGSPNQDNTGSLTISVPALATWLQQYQSDSEKKPSSRALARATSVTIEVLDSEGNPVIEPARISIENYGIGSSATATLPLIPIGTGYTVRASVYNSAVSETEPVVTGEATDVAILENETTLVAIRCLPVNPIAITTDSGSLSFEMIYESEVWYSLSVTTGTQYYFTQLGDDIVLGIFNDEGAYLTSSNSYIDYESTYSGTLYIVLYSQGYPETTANLSVTTTEPILNEGSVESPVALSLNSEHTYKVGSNNSPQNSSYYSFTTSASGTYAIDLEEGYFWWSLYSDTNFTETMTQTDGAYGVVFENLAASTTYYLVMSNTSYSKIFTTMGTISDPATIEANTQSQGSITSPVSLEIGSSLSGILGHHVYDSVSYYQFTTSTGLDYEFSFSDATNDSQSIGFTIYEDSEFSSYVYSNYFDYYPNPNNFGTTLAPETTYYMLVKNPAEVTETHNFTLVINETLPPDFITLPIGDWTEGSIDTSGQVLWYEVNVTGGQTYTLNWDDSFEGSGTYTCALDVSAYQQDRITPYFEYQDSGFNSGQTIAVPEGQSIIYLKVRGYYGAGYTGTFALKLTE